MSCRFDSACSVSPAMNSSATCRLNAALCDRCLVMAPILRKPSRGGQFQPLNLSTPRGALHREVAFALNLSELVRQQPRRSAVTGEDTDEPSGLPPAWVEWAKVPEFLARRYDIDPNLMEGLRQELHSQLLRHNPRIQH